MQGRREGGCWEGAAEASSGGSSAALGLKLQASQPGLGGAGKGLKCKLVASDWPPARSPRAAPQNAPPNVMANASCWALQMGISSNLRYQMLNGLDMVREENLAQRGTGAPGNEVARCMQHLRLSAPARPTS